LRAVTRGAKTEGPKWSGGWGVVLRDAAETADAAAASAMSAAVAAAMVHSMLWKRRLVGLVSRNGGGLERVDSGSSGNGNGVGVVAVLM